MDSGWPDASIVDDFRTFQIVRTTKRFSTRLKDSLLRPPARSHFLQPANFVLARQAMDVVLPSHSIRLFGAAISSLSRIGSSDLYWEFDPITGLELRTLNDAKSAYGWVHFGPSFFERCTTNATTCNTATTATRPLAAATDGTSHKKRRRGSYNDSDDDDNDSGNNSTQGSAVAAERFTCRVAFKALSPIVRPRKNLHSLRICSSGSSGGGILCLDFEFTTKHRNDALLTAVHRVRIAQQATAVSVVVSNENASEIVVVPSVLARLLDPLQRTMEAALIVRNNGGNSNSSVSASSFHHTDTTSALHASNNAILQASSASLLKSETACGCDEFLDFDFVSNRETLGHMSDNVTDNDNDETAVVVDMPEEVNQEVILVFSLREAKAMLQFCCLQLELVVNVTFHWGGRPLVFKASTDTYSIQLVLATLDYKLLTSMRTMPSVATDN
jgi:Rad9